jgi:tellurite resistance protein TehA-like permease
VILTPLLDALNPGWDELIATHNPVLASYTMFNTALIGYFVVGLFLTFQIMLYFKTKSALLGFLMNMLFLGAWIGNVAYIKDTAMPLIFLILAIQIGVILYTILWRRD